jgi:transcriptional regulator with XRE-family HTH domain
MSTAPALSKLEGFIKKHGLKPAQVAREADMTRQQLVRIRYGRVERPHFSTKEAIAGACSRLSGVNVTIADLFDE